MHQSADQRHSVMHVSVLEWLEAQGKMRPVPHVGPALPHGVEPPERPPAAELIFLHKIQDQIRHPPDTAWTAAELAGGVSRLFESLPLAEQQRYCSEAREGREQYEAELARLSVQRGRPDQNEVIKPRRKKDQKTKRGDTKGVVVTIEVLETVFHMPLHKACKALGVCATAMKRVCRKLGVKKWPYRDSARWCATSSRQPVTWTKGSAPTSLAPAEKAVMAVQNTGGQLQTGVAGAQRRIAVRPSSAAAASKAAVEKETQENKGNDLIFESGSQYEGFPDGLHASYDGDESSVLVLEDADAVPDDQDSVSWTSSGLTSPTRTGSPDHHMARYCRDADDSVAMESFDGVLPTFGISDVQGPGHMQVDADLRLDYIEGLVDQGAGVPRLQIRAMGPGSKRGNATAMQSSRVMNGSSSVSNSNRGPMANAPQAPAGKAKRNVRQHKAGTIATWPSHASQLCKGVNDTWNSFQRLHKGRSVTSAEWKAARALLWSMAPEAAAHDPPQHYPPVVAAGAYFH